jgi:UDP-N-acetylglucosamine--N-acetylmuramyl-(pentapeptide) pyrophosphoryl-undecaprenol N-acetylglucosamine transferase
VRGTVLLAGGGTGGHVFPSLAVAAALRDADAELAIEFVGTARGLESRLVPEAGWTLHAIEAMAIQRKLSPSLLRVPGLLARATRQVGELIAARNVVAAVVFGGYVSAPLAVAAWRAKVPLIVHEQNAIPGLANRLAGRWAAAIATTHELSRFGRVAPVVTGNPVRPGLDRDSAVQGRAAALAHFDLEAQRRTLLVFGGSQGAKRINDAAVASATRWSAPAQLQILHATGRGSYETVAADWKEALAQDTPAPLVRCIDFIDKMEFAYAAADVVVCRAGASTLAELTVLGLPSVLVPYPHATADHQTANARSVSSAGGAVLVPDAELDGARLVGAAEPLLLDEQRREQMAAAARSVGKPDAAQRVAQLVLDQIAARQTGAPR